MSYFEKSKTEELQNPQIRKSQTRAISVVSAGVLALTSFITGCIRGNDDYSKAQGRGNCSPTDKKNDLTENERLAIKKYSEYKKLRTNREDLFESFRLADEALLNGSKCVKLIEGIKVEAKKELDQLEK